MWRERLLLLSVAAVFASCGRSELASRGGDATEPGEDMSSSPRDMYTDGGDLGEEPLPDMSDSVDATIDTPDMGEDVPDMVDEPDLSPTPTCSDERRNGAETDIDCGGGACPACPDGARCEVDTDCEDSPCVDGICGGEEDPGLALGEPCERDEQCASEQCEAFGSDRICTQPCAGACPGDGLVCFDGLCTPDTYCESDDGLGRGPGCAGSPCERCADDASCMIAPDGAVTCLCNPGFVGDGETCQDIDECADPATCAPEATCTNLPGGFECACPDGFTGDGFICQDVDECADPALNDCDANATCANLPGAFACTCNEGYDGDGETCADVDECAEGIDDCDANATCTNTDGSYTCACNMGYAGDGENCQDVDECQNFVPPCPAGQQCFNTDGGYTCGCQPGYQADATGACVDVDECADPALNDCDANATCANLPGTFTCACDPGFVGDGKTCSPSTAPLGDTCDNPFDVPSTPFSASGDTRTDANNDYSRPQNACPFGATSQRGAASNDEVYRFTPTQTGVYTIDVEDQGFPSAAILTTDCQDIQNTCVLSDTFDPSFSATLQAGTTYYLIIDGAGNNTNTAGNYTVSIDLDECASGLDSCPMGATCQDTFGSFLCTCPDGFQLTNGLCADIDECADPALNDCDANATCTNTDGGFTCACNMGFIGDGETCWDPNAPGETCAAPFAITSMPFAIQGDTSDANNDYSYGNNTCPGEIIGRGAGSNDEVYAFTPTTTGSYRFDLSGSWGVNLYVLNDCASVTSMTCLAADGRFSNGGVDVTVDLMAGQTYYIVVDGSGNFSNRSGSYVLSGVAVP